MIHSICQNGKTSFYGQMNHPAPFHLPPWFTALSLCHQHHPHSNYISIVLSKTTETSLSTPPLTSNTSQYRHNAAHCSSSTTSSYLQPFLYPQRLGPSASQGISSMPGMQAIQGAGSSNSLQSLNIFPQTLNRDSVKSEKAPPSATVVPNVAFRVYSIWKKTSGGSWLTNGRL